MPIILLIQIKRSTKTGDKSMNGIKTQLLSKRILLQVKTTVKTQNRQLSAVIEHFGRARVQRFKNWSKIIAF